MRSGTTASQPESGLGLEAKPIIEHLHSLLATTTFAACLAMELFRTGGAIGREAKVRSFWVNRAFWG